MRCKPLRWLFGLPGLALIGAVALLGELPHIRVDLRDRANAALDTAGYGWAKLDLDARDMSLTGTATDEREQQAALDVVHGIWGVRIVSDQTSLIEALQPYLWSLSRDGAKLQIGGYADTDANRKAVAAAAGAQLRGLTVQQNLKLARGMPQREQWLAAIGYASSLSAGLRKGSVKLEDLGLTISGEAASPQAYSDIRKALAGDHPAGLVLVNVAITPPVISPFTWSASWQNRSLALDGYIASDAARQHLLESAKTLFPGVSITDHMLLAGGEPDQFGSVQDLVLNGLAQLENGKATVQATNADLRGIATEQDTAESVSKVVRGGIPAGFKVADAITFRKAHLAVVNPYKWSAELSGRDLTIEGFVPDERTRSDLNAYAAGRFKGARIADRTSIAAGVPDNFAAAARAGLQDLARLDRGKLRLIGTDVDLSGHAADKAVANGTETEFAALLPASFSHTTGITFDPPKVVEQTPVKAPEPPKTVKEPVATTPAPYVLDAVLDNGAVVLTGTVPNAEARSLLQLQIGSRLPGVKVIDKLSISGGLPSSRDDWLRNVDAGLKAVADLGAGHAHLTERMLSVSGVTRDKAMPEFVAESLRRAVPAGYATEAKIDYQAAEIAAAYLTTLKYDGLKVVLEGSVPDPGAKSKLMAQLKPLFPDREFDDRTQVRSGAPPDWYQALSQGIGPLSELDAGQLTLRDRSLLLSGTTEDDKVLATARQKVSSGLPKGYAGNDQLTYVAPPTPDPKVLAQKQDESKYDVKKLISQSASLSAPECQAVLNSVVRGKALFETGRAQLGVHSIASLNSIVSLARRCPGMHVEVSGHTDSDGAASFNQRLSEQRAQAVVNYLQRQGVDSNQMNSVGFGESKPIAPNTTPVNKAKNRRIDISVSQAKG